MCATGCSESSMSRLRHERLLREAAERVRGEQAMRQARGEKEPSPVRSARTQKYNSQFNPDVARQNRPSVHTRDMRP